MNDLKSRVLVFEFCFENTITSVGWPNQITRGVIVQDCAQGIYKAVIPSFTHGTIVKKFAWLKCIQS